MARLIIIAAIGENNELGKDNHLIWKISEDLNFFKEKTNGHYIVMGRKTFESLPKILDNRTHIVLSKSNLNLPDNVIVINSVEKFLEYINNINDDIYVIGGAMIYSKLINYCQIMYLTEIQSSDINADTFFPTFDKNDWNEQIIGNFLENDLKYIRKKYTKRL